ncbi:MAG TPA: DUF4240 domain-containing protein [Amycolatopsis sp.]|nr:DUF4240 domain-containing protein [Amycolatopsis sp.]
MKERRFWRVTAKAGADRTALLGLLADLPAPEVIRFHRTLVAIHYRAYRWDVLVAFAIVLGEMNARVLTDAISWLILRGRRTFRGALVDPDLLATLTADHHAVAEARWLLRAAQDRLEPAHDPDDDTRLIDEALREVLGDVDFRRPPPGERPTLDAESLRSRYPRLARRFPVPDLAAPAWLEPERRRDVVSDA